MILIFSFSDKEQHIWIKKFLKYQVLGVSVWGVRTNEARGWKASLTALMVTDLVTFEAS